MTSEVSRLPLLPCGKSDRWNLSILETRATKIPHCHLEPMERELTLSPALELIFLSGANFSEHHVSQ